MDKFEITITETRKATLEIDPANYPEGSTKEEMLAIEKKGAETQVEYMDMLDATSEITIDHFPIGELSHDKGGGCHPSHCCARCGCKYNDEDCPVVTGEVTQDYDCDGHCRDFS